MHYCSSARAKSPGWVRVLTLVLSYGQAAEKHDPMDPAVETPPSRTKKLMTHWHQAQRQGLWRRPPRSRNGKYFVRGLFVNFFRTKGQKAKKGGPAQQDMLPTTRSHIPIRNCTAEPDPIRSPALIAAALGRTEHRLFRSNQCLVFYNCKI